MEICFSSSSSCASSSSCQSCFSRNAAIFFFQFGARQLFLVRLGRVGRVQLLQILGQARVGPRDEFRQLLLVVVAVARVDRRQLRAVNGHQFAAEQFQLVAEQMELPVHELEAGAVLAAKVGDGLEVRRQLAQQPEHFQVALTFGLQQARGTHAMQR